MSKEDVKNYVLERLDLGCAKSDVEEEALVSPMTLDSQAPAQEGSTSETSKVATVSKPKKLSLKGKARPAIVGYWQNGEGNHFLHLNSAIHTTLGAMHAEGLTKDDAAEIVFQYACDIPNKELSSRLGDGLASVRKDIVRNAAKIWDKPVNKIWQKSVACWESYGFRVSDKNT